MKSLVPVILVLFFAVEAVGQDKAQDSKPEKQGYNVIDLIGNSRTSDWISKRSNNGLINDVHDLLKELDNTRSLPLELATAKKNTEAILAAQRCIDTFTLAQKIHDEAANRLKLKPDDFSADAKKQFQENAVRLGAYAPIIQRLAEALPSPPPGPVNVPSWVSGPWHTSGSVSPTYSGGFSGAGGGSANVNPNINTITFGGAGSGTGNLRGYEEPSLPDAGSPPIVYFDPRIPMGTDYRAALVPQPGAYGVPGAGSIGGNGGGAIHP